MYKDFHSLAEAARSEKSLEAIEDWKFVTDIYNAQMVSEAEAITFEYANLIRTLTGLLNRDSSKGFELTAKSIEAPFAYKHREALKVLDRLFESKATSHCCEKLLTVGFLNELDEIVSWLVDKVQRHEAAC